MAYQMNGKQLAANQSKLGSGGRFKALSGGVAAEYEKKGMGAKKAEAIGAAVAAKQGANKYGQKKMTAMAKKGKKGPARNQELTQ